MQSSARAAVLASFVADSLALGVHWMYDTAQIDQQFGRVTDLLQPLAESYHPTKKRGDLTHYGDQSLHLLHYLARHGGRFSLASYAPAWQGLWHEYKGYVDRATRVTLHNLEAGNPPETSGSPSTDLGGGARIAPLLYCYRQDLQGLLAAVQAQTALTHNSPPALAAAVFLARSSFAILHGSPPRQAFLQALENGVNDLDLDLRLRRCLDLPATDIRGVIKDFGQMCSVSAALPGAIYTVLQNENNLEEALIETAMAGGDSAARGMVVGMILGAHLGMDKIPTRWLKNLASYQEIEAALDKLSSPTYQG